LLALSRLLPDFNIDSTSSSVIFLFILSLFNWTVVPIIKFFSLPLNIMTLGVFNILINLATLLFVVNILEGVDLTGNFVENLITGGIILAVLVFSNSAFSYYLKK